MGRVRAETKTTSTETENMFGIENITPTAIPKGKDLENEAKFSLEPEMKMGNCHFNKYGVQMSIMAAPGGKSVANPDGLVYRPNKSLPDFEGVIRGGRQFVFDCKLVTATPNYRVYNDMESSNKKRQINHLLRRGAMGAISGFLIHFNRRELKTKTDEAGTYWFPCHSDHSFWIRFAAGEEKVIGREHCQQYGRRVGWHVPPRCHRPRMKLMELIDALDQSEVELFTERPF